MSEIEERLASAEDVLKNVAEYAAPQGVVTMAKSHLDKYTKPDPDKELRQKVFEQIMAITTEDSETGEILCASLLSLNLLATESVINKAKASGKRGLLNEIEYTMNTTLYELYPNSKAPAVATTLLEIIKELQSKYSGGE